MQRKREGIFYMEQKETVDMREHARQLNEQELYCVAKHLQAFLQLTVNEDQYFILPCRVCKYNWHELCGIDRTQLMNKISNQTGVELSFWKGFKPEDFKSEKLLESLRQ